MNPYTFSFYRDRLIATEGHRTRIIARLEVETALGRFRHPSHPATVRLAGFTFDESALQAALADMDAARSQAVTA